MTLFDEPDAPRPRRPLASHQKNLAETIERLYRREATAALQKVLAKLLPADLAHLLESFPLEMAIKLFLGISDPHSAALVLKELPLSLQNDLISSIDMSRTIPILEKMAPDARTDILSQLEPELTNRYLAGLNLQTRKEVNSLMQYPPDTAGGLMTSQFFALSENTTVAQAIDAVRQLASYEMVFYVYVINKMGCLTGVSSLRHLLLTPPDKTMAEMMNRRIVHVHTDTPQNEVAEIASHYRLLAIPVVDEEDVLVGMVTVDDVIQIIRDEVADDMFKAAGTSASEVEATTAWDIFKIRLPWLFTTFLGGFLASGVVMVFESTLAKALVLAAFLPVILGMGGNFGSVASMVVVRMLSAGSSPSYGRLLLKEMAAGLLMGTFYGSLAGGMVWMIFKDLFLTGAVAITILTNMVMAATIAVSLPTLFLHFGAEPSKASGPVVTMMVDLIGVCFYFLVAWLLHHHLPN